MEEGEGEEEEQQMIMVSPLPTAAGGRSSSSSARSKWRRAQLMVAVTNSFRDAGKEGSERRAEAAAKASVSAEIEVVQAATEVAAVEKAAAMVRRVSSVERLQRAERLDQSKAKLRRVVAKVKAVNRFKLMADTSGNGKAGTVRALGVTQGARLLVSIKMTHLTHAVRV